MQLRNDPFSYAELMDDFRLDSRILTRHFRIRIAMAEANHKDLYQYALISAAYALWACLGARIQACEWRYCQVRFGIGREYDKR